jgi:hypothetical protein
MLLPELVGQHFKFIHPEDFHVLFRSRFLTDMVHCRTAGGQCVLVVPKGE